MTSHAAGLLAVIGAALLWGTTGTVQSVLPAARDPLAVGALRLLVGAAALAALALARPDSRRGFRRLDWPAVIGAGLAMAAYNLLFFRAVLSAGVGVGTALAIGSAPVWVTLFALARGRGLPDRRRLAGQAVSIAGAALLVLAGTGEAASPGRAAAGALLALLAGAAYALFSLATLRAGRAAPPATVAASAFAVAALVTLPVLGLRPPTWLAEPGALPAILFLGIGATGLAYALYTWGLARVGAATAVTLALIEPATAWVLATAVVGEPVTLPRLAGAGLILAGLAIVTLGPAGRSRPA